MKKQKLLTKNDLIKKINSKFIQRKNLYIPRIGELSLFKKEVSVMSPDAHQRGIKHCEEQIAYALSYNEYGDLAVRLRCYIDKYENNLYLDNVIKLDRFKKPDVERILQNY